MAFLLAILLIVVLAASWLLTLLGLPGNWLMVAAVALYAWLAPAHGLAALGWKTVSALLVLAALGEIGELLAGAVGTARAGGSRWGAALALLGSLVGGMLGIVVGLPVPLVGPILAAVLFAALGAMAGALLGETWSGKGPAASWRIAKRAFQGRLAGTLAKMLLGALMIAVVVVAMLC
ncbi:MAG: DUF456 domain-containing protein [Thermoguttaceae bacterium]